MGYIEKLNVKVSPFTMGNQNAYYYFHGKRVSIGDANANPDTLGSTWLRTNAARRRRNCGRPA